MILMLTMLAETRGRNLVELDGAVTASGSAKGHPGFPDDLVSPGMTSAI
jgi:hypothetical protein